MSKTAVSVILDKALTACFDHHIQHSAPSTTPEDVQYCDAQRKFTDSLSEEQQAAYRKLEGLLTDVESKENEHYYRLGFKDGHAAWRGA